MKTNVLFVLSALSWSLACADEPLPDMGPHHRRITAPAGVDMLTGQATAPDSCIQLEPGLNRWENGQWVPAEASLEIINNTVVARRTAHKVIWAANAASKGLVDLEMVDGTRLVSHCLGLGYYDSATGQSVLIAEVKDSIAEVHPPDMVLYPDCFDDVKASLLFVSRPGLFEQLILIEGSLPEPGDYGLNPETTRLEAITEFLDPPQPARERRVLRSEHDARKRAAMVEPDLVDEGLDFGEMRMVEGVAFLPTGEPWKMDAAAKLPVAKRWNVIDGRTVLFEAVEFPGVARLIAQLKPRQPGSKVAALRKPTPTRTLPSRRIANRAEPPQMMASLDRIPFGVVLDYTLSSGVVNYRFRGDYTYYCTAAISCTGTNTILEAGAVLKLAPTNNAHLDFASSNVTWQGTAYRPIVVSASDDVSVGSNATTNSLSGYYGTTALNFQAPLTAVSIAHLRVAHAKGAIAFSQGTGHTLSHVQIVNCGKGLILNGAEVRLRNALMVNVTTNFDLASSTARVEHLTTDGTSLLNTGGTLYLTNSLVVAATATNGWSGLSNVFVASATGVFASVGNGAHYLASGSPYRDVGTASIDATLDKELKTMTTVAPIWLSSAITTATTLGPLAARDTDQRDCGYHYPALDYLLSNVTVQAALTLTNGVALGLCGTAGLNLQSGSSVRSEGTPIALNRFAGIPLVQEQPVPLGQAKGMIQQGFYNPLVRLRFTDVSLKGGATVAVFDPGSYAFSEFSLRDSWLRCADFSANPSSNLVTVASAMTNNVIERGTFSFYHSYGSQGSYHVVSLYNNLFSRSTLNLSFDPGTGYIPTWRAQDNLFDGASPSGSGTGYATYVTVGYNGFTSGTSNGLGGNNNKTGLTADFVTGSLGAFYYPTNGSGLFTLVNAGSRTATNATLCQFTVSNVAGSKDSGTVEIGFHYVAIDSSGLPYDTDGDGISDDQEDRNGSGSVDSGETDWQTSNSGISGAAGLQVFTPLH